MYKISNYNHFQPWQGDYFVAFNALSGAVALMTRDNYSRYLAISEKLSLSSHNGFTDEDNSLLEQLKFGKFVLSANGDETASLKFAHNLHRYDQTTLGLTIAPTLNCNLGCKYCYEENKTGRMKSDTIDAIMKRIGERADALNRVDINWYGGEPLLALDIIEELTVKLLDMAKEKNFRYSSSMISNGYLLSKDNVQKLRELKVSILQVTIDGPRRIHDTRRPLKNGNGSFDRILENIKYASDYIGIGVRVNVDRNFSEEIIKELLDELVRAGLQKKIGVYFGQLEPASSVCANIADHCYNANEFSQAEVKYYRLLLDNGFHVQKLPSPISVYCMAQGIGAHLIDPDGDLYRCYNHVGIKEKSCGNIADDFDFQHPIFREYFDFDPFTDESCRTCEILPICMGGCPSRRIDRGLKGEERCETWKHNLDSMLDIIAISRRREQLQKEQDAELAREKL